MSQATRNPNNLLFWPSIAFGGVTLGLTFVGILQVGHRFTGSDGTWLAGNPLEVIEAWVEGGRPWTGIHTTLATVIGFLMLGLAGVVSSWIAAHQVRKEHIDNKAKLMGRGKEMSLTAVTARNNLAGLTTSETVGMFLARLVLNGSDLYAGWRSTVVAIMGTGSGKTSALAVPFAWNAPGWLYGTSNKRDFSDAIWDFRAKRGDVRVFDPQNIADTPATWYWDPLSYVTDDVHALILANLWADATMKLDAKPESGYFDTAGRSLVANLLLAAAEAKLPVTQVVKWIARPDKDTPVDILIKAGWELNAVELQGAYDLNSETKRGVFGNAATTVSFLINRSAQQWVSKLGPDDDRPSFDAADFVRSSGDTLISLSMEGVGSLGPLVASLTTAVMEAAENYAKTCIGGRLPVPGVFVLDEAANVVRIKELPDKYSHYASRGIFILTILQSRAQGESAWGKTGMEKMLGAATHVLVGRGIKDAAFLKDLSELVGPYDRREYSSGTSTGGPNRGFLSAGNRSVNSSYHSKPILNPAEIHALPEWRALIMSAGERPVLAELIPYFHKSNKEMHAAVDASNAVHGSAAVVSV